MKETTDILEKQRQILQAELDAQKTQAERNCLGQFATPPALAKDLLRYAATLLPPRAKVHFLDPAIGTGSFYSALRAAFPNKRIAEALGFEIDQHYGKPAARLWKNTALTMKLSDFTHATPSPRYNLIICNPPYVRHHHLETATRHGSNFSPIKQAALKSAALRVFTAIF